MKRRDLLKAIGISGLLPFVKSEPAEAAPSPAPQVIEPKPFTMGSASIRGAQEYASGTATWFPMGTGPYDLEYLLNRQHTIVDFGGDK